MRNDEEIIRRRLGSYDGPRHVAWKAHRALDRIMSLLQIEMRDSIHFEAALRFYADGGVDAGEKAREALETIPSDVHISELLEKELV